MSAVKDLENAEETSKLYKETTVPVVAIKEQDPSLAGKLKTVSSNTRARSVSYEILDCDL